MSSASDKVNLFLAKANIKFSAPVSSYLLLSKPASSPEPDTTAAAASSARKAYVIDHKNIKDILETSKQVLATVDACSHLCTAVNPESNLRLLRLQTDSSHSLIITGMPPDFLISPKKIYESFMCSANH